MTDTLAPRPHPARTLLVLGFGAVSYALVQTAIIPALSDMEAGLHTSPEAGAWAVTAFLISAAVLTPVLGRLGDMFGRRRTLIVAMGLFAIGSVISALAPTMAVMVIGRVVQGAAGGALPLSFAIIRDEFPRDRVAQGVALVAATTGIGGGLGLVVGGVMSDHLSFRWIFWIGAALAALSAALVALLVPETPNRKPGRVDVRGALVLAVGVTLPLIAIARANQWGWGAPQTLGLIAAGLVVLALWTRLERATPHALADVALLRYRPVLVTNVTSVFMGFATFTSFLIVPLIVQAPTSTGYGFGGTATTSALILLPGALIMMVMAPVSGAMGRRFGNKVPLTLGCGICALGLTLLAVEHNTELELAAFHVVNMMGVCLTYAANPNLIVDAVPIDRTGEATGFNLVLRSVGSSLGAQLTATVLSGGVLVATGYPSDEAMTRGFLMGAGVAMAAGLVAFAIPRRFGTHVSVGEEIAAGAPLPAPVLVGTER